MPDLPLDHVLRHEPPWREQRLTECGRPSADVASLVDRSVLVAKIKAQGQQRAAFTTCMTCWGRMSTYRPWDEEPCEVINRDSRGHQDQLHRELQALTVLWQEHQEEFRAIMIGLGEVGDLGEHRRRMRRRR